MAEKKQESSWQDHVLAAVLDLLGIEIIAEQDLITTKVKFKAVWKEVK